MSALLLYYLGDEVEIPVNRGSYGLVKPMLVGFGYDVGAQALNQVLRMRHRLDPARVDAPHLLDQSEHPVQPLQHGCGFVGPDREPGEPGEAADLVV
jgi:hypothetical protein